MNEDFKNFKDRKCKANEIFYIKEINKVVAYEFVKKYHYLGNAKFFCVQAFGLFYKKDNELVGCATYSLPQGIATLKSWFNLSNQTKNIYELSRLCMLPVLNGTNATSFLLSGSIKELKKQNNEIKNKIKKMKDEDWKCRGIITLALASRHVGAIYQVCNFKYYGMTEKWQDFYREDGKINPRGKRKNVAGVLLPRIRKHRYAYILDKTLKVNYNEMEKPTSKTLIDTICCNGKKIVHDERLDRYYTCPRCTGNLKRLNKDGSIYEEQQSKEQLSIFDL